MRSAILVIAGLFLSILLPLILLHTNVLQKASGLELFSYAVGVLGLSITALYTIFDIRLAHVSASVSRIPDYIAGGVERKVDELGESIRDMADILVYTVDRETVYTTLQDFVVNAKSRVDLMYCGTRPPTAYLRSASKESYVGELDRIVKEHGKSVRRMIRFTQDNKEWIRSVVDTHTGNSSFSLSIVDIEPEIPLVSAQLIDDDKCILMNMDRSTSPNRPRDLVFESHKVANIVDSYFNDMFSRAVPLLENGTPRAEHVEKYLGPSKTA